MKKKLFLTLMLSFGMAFSHNVSTAVAAEQVPLQTGYVDPTNGQDNPNRGPITPVVTIEDYTLTFSTPCYGYTLELLDGDGEVVYTTIINSTTVNLPSTLSGSYELCLYPDESNIYFFGYVLF